MNGTLSALYHYPVKGLSAQPLDSVALEAGRGFPLDRVFGIARHDSGFDPRDPQPLPKNRFFMLMKDERLAELDTHYDPQTGSLAVRVGGRTVLDADISTAEGAGETVSFFAAMFDLDAGSRPVFAHAEPHRFTDVSVVSKEMMNAVSLINLASVAEFGERIGETVDPIRFRANIYFDGWPPFGELDLVGREIAIGDARLRIVKRTQRCAATQVNPATARRDIAVPRLLMQTYGHSDMGVYAEVLVPGEVRPGDAISC